MLAEAALLGSLSGAAAFLVMRGEVALVQDWLTMEGATALHVEARSLVELVIVVAVAAVGCVALPIFWASRLKISDALREGGGRLPPRLRLQSLLSVGQIGLTLVLLAQAGEFAISVRAVSHQDLGMDIDRVLVVSAGLAQAGYSQGQAREIWSRGGERVKRLPGVEQTSLAALVPFESSLMRAIQVPGLDRLPKLPMGGPYVNEVSEDYFGTVGTPVLRGRGFTAWDRRDSAPVVVVNQTMARLLWPGRSALGGCLRIGRGRVPCSTVVGIVKNVRQFGLEERPTMQYYVPLGQGESGASLLFVRVRGKVERMKELVRRGVQASAAGLPYVRVRSLADVIAPQVRPWQTGTRVLGFFGSLALGLSIVGLNGVMAHWIGSHLPGFLVRVALGAPRYELVRVILLAALRIGAGGVTLGVILTVAMEHSVEPLLFDFTGWQPWVLGWTAACLGAVILMVSLLSGLRVFRLNPAAVLKAE
jgi:predicted permease